MRGERKNWARGILASILAVGLAAAAFAKTPAAKPAAQAQGSANCMSCHGDGASGYAMRAAQEQFRESSHWLGFRTPSAPGSVEPVEFRNVTHEATQDSTTSHPESTGCPGCHTEQGFRQRLEQGKSNGLTTVTNPLRVECFTCHQPHTNGNFNLVSTAPVPSISKTKGATGRTFDGGKGNLCAMCHRLVLNQPDGFHALWDGRGKDESVRVELHVFGHQPQEVDYMLGQGEWPFDSNYDGTGKPLPYNTENPHYSMVQDTCVGCHMKYPGQPDGLAGHTFFLTNYRKDLTAGCATCHGVDSFRIPGKPGGIRFRDAKIASPESLVDYDGDGKAAQMLVEIEGLRNTLVDYFITPANFQAPAGGSPAAPLRKLAHPDPPGTLKPVQLTSYTLYSDYRTNGAAPTAFTRAQAESFYNLRMILFDASYGIHNPRFAAQVLFDSIMNLNVNAHAALKIGAKRP